DGVIGGVCVRELNLLNRSAEIEIFAEPELKKLGEFTDGVLALIGHLFRTYNLNSLYSQTTAADSRTSAALEELGFSRDGALRHRHFYQGEFGDVYIYSLLRYEFEM
ncbi:MAG TPA: GNAT family protein, partial [candidate division Zixibacteria bacterium]|nr:GNAT family protein [candidate division Zixibacteria bacterium]